MKECSAPSHWHYQMLDEDKKMIYKSILLQIKMAGGQGYHAEPFQDLIAQNLLTIRVPGNGGTENGFYEKEIYNDILMGILLDDPLLFQLDLTRVLFYRDASSVSMILKLVYDSGTYQALMDQMQKKAQKICSQIASLETEKQKILYLHDYLCGQCEYDVYHYGAFPGDQYVRSREIHTIIGPLQNESCVCDGFANAFLYLCEQCGIACIHVRGQLVKDGKAKTHAWNMVKCEGRYWHMDLCLDHLYSDKTIAKGYCFRTDLDMETGHRWNKDQYPKTNSAKR